MKTADAKVGGKYYANVSGKRVEIRLDEAKTKGGWVATNLSTGKKIHVKSAQRLLGEVGASRKRTKVRAETNAANVEASVAETTTKKPKKTAQPAGEKKLSAIEAAVKVLAESTAPMNCKELIEVMNSKGLWSTPGGKTPHATLYSAILREITTKGTEARFVKADRGRFAASR